MITDIPQADNFKEAGSDFLNIAWDIVMELLMEINSESYEYLEESEIEQYWENAQRHLSTALSLVQQGTEFLLKSRITDISPYLLLISPPDNWPRQCDKQDTSFSEFKTLDAQDLIKVYNTVYNNEERLTDEFKIIYNRLRSERNKNIHTYTKSLKKKKVVLSCIV